MSGQLKTWLIVGLVCAAGAVAGWRLWPFAVHSKTTSQGADPAYADLAFKANEFLRHHMGTLKPADSVRAFESAHAVEAAAADLSRAGLSKTDAEAAMAHAAAMMHVRFIDKNYDRYTAWRTDAGYRFFPAERLRQDPAYRDAIESGAGRALRDDEHDTTDLWRLYWNNVIEPSGRVVEVAQAADGMILLAWKSAEGLGYAKGGPGRRAVASPIMTTEPGAPGSRVGLWRGGTITLGWPVWFPPPEVEARLLRPGTSFIEIAWVVRTHDGKVQPLTMSLAMDPQTRRWWIMQWTIPHTELGVQINMGGV
ncbi:MAG: hypothetical protein HUU18_08640 [Phycisphaerales bacterium]|nr:hypothetical protein [Phycisphaerales bacterium]